MKFRPACETLDEALSILERERARLLRVVPSGELSLTGASSLPGALTGGDVDLHLRVPAGEFERAVVALRAVGRVVHPEIWTRDLATFEMDGHALPVGVAVTAVDGEHDRYFRRAWELLAADAGALAAYNALKRAHEDAEEDAYRAAKADFFARLVPPDGSEGR